VGWTIVDSNPGRDNRLFSSPKISRAVLGPTQPPVQ